MHAPEESSNQKPAFGRDLLLWLAAGGGAGLAPCAPGTLGSLVGLAIAYGFSFASPAITWAGLGLAAAAGPAICARGARAAGRGDPGWVVWDEIVGVWLAVQLAPHGWPTGGLAYALAFGLFRLYDIAKPGLIRRCERLPGGYGVMADDVAAGVAAAATAWLLRWAFGQFA